MTKEITCCFTGHRTLYKPAEKISAELDVLLREMYERGFRRFCCGGAVGFDTLAEKAVLRLKEKHDDVTLSLILPCLEQTKKWKAADVAVYEEILTLADEIVYTCNHFAPFCMHMRNRRLVDESSVCIAYLVTDSGGTFSTVKYAEQQEIEIIRMS